MNTNKKILITDEVHSLLPNSLKAEGWQVDYMPAIRLEELYNIIEPYRGIIINSKIIADKKLLDCAPNLQFICRLGSGLDIIDLPYAASRNVEIISAPEGNRNAVAEQALGMLLALLNNLCRADRQVRQKIWAREANRGIELSGRTIGIIGCGNTGFAFLNKLSGLGVQVLAYDKYKKYYLEPSGYAMESDLDNLLQKSDIISFHLPLTEETRYLVNESFIKRCKDGVLLINTSRGKVVHNESLIRGLESGKIGGAALDVFENEKPESFSQAEEAWYERLYAMENVILSPHIAGWTLESKKKIAEIVLSRIRSLFENS